MATSPPRKQPMTERPDDVIVAHYDQALSQFGDTARGALWPNDQDRQTRFDVMLDVLADRRGEPLVLCDLGCGTGELLTRIQQRGIPNLTYIGVDRSEAALDYARAKFPGTRFLNLDVNAPDADLSQITCDFLVANGLFTVRHVLDEQQMAAFIDSTIRRVWPHVRAGIAFNLMSGVVDWRRDDLFHASMDDMARLLHELAGRRVRMRADYGLYEFTCYAYKHLAPSANEVRSDAPVRVLRPSLPTAERLLPYLKRIDQARIYSNFGPLVLEFESRVCTRLGLPAGAVVSASTGTAGLVGAILATAGRATAARTLALMPAYTFVATAVAARECGYEPYLADVDAETWMLDPERLIDHPSLDRVGIVIPVAAFGKKLDQSAWLRFREKSGIAVVIDAAAGFESVSEYPQACLGPIPVVLSFHATKSFATGEGGCVASTDIELVARTCQCLNYGFRHSRDSQTASINGKMSEYHAAVGLAELDQWDAKRAAFQGVVDNYLKRAAEAGIGTRLKTAPGISSSYILFQCDSVEHAERAQAELAADHIEYRLWYGLGLHRQTHFSALPRDPLSVTERLAPCVIGLPMATDLDDASIERVVRAMVAGSRQ